MFYVGQKVTMKAPWWEAPSAYGETFTEMGVVYTVREAIVVRGKEAIRVCEIVNTPRRYNGFADAIEQPFPASNFRPVVERKTDIGFAHEILRKVTKRKPAHV